MCCSVRFCYCLWFNIFIGGISCSVLGHFIEWNVFKNLMSYLWINLTSLASWIYLINVQPLSREISRAGNCVLRTMRQGVVIFWVLLGTRGSHIFTHSTSTESMWDEHYKPQVWIGKLRSREIFHLPASAPTSSTISNTPTGDIGSQSLCDLLVLLLPIEAHFPRYSPLFSITSFFFAFCYIILIRTQAYS